MAHASTIMATPGIRMPSVAIPRLRWPFLSPRTRAFLMIAIMISPCFLSDTIGYWVQRAFYTANELAEREASRTALTQIRIFQVACPGSDMPAGERGWWAAYAAQHGWPLYPEAGAGCFKPDTNLRGVMGIMAFSVACPVMALSAAGERQWVAYTASREWAPYPQAGLGCVDP